MANNNHNSNNQPRRKRNKKPVKRYSEEYSNRPNPYTGYSADGNYHPEAKRRPAGDTQSPRAKAAEEERVASMNAAMAEAAWGPVASKSQQPQQPQQSQQPSRQIGFAVPTVNVPAPKWAVSNNLTRQQMAEQAQASDGTDQENDTETVLSGGNASSHRSESSHRRKNHRSKDEAARERAAKIEAKRAAVDKIAMGVAAHSVSEQMIDDISSMSDAIESMSKPQRKPPADNGVNWEEFYDAAFPPKSQEHLKFGAKKTKPPKKQVNFGDDTSADAPMIVKPVMLGDDELLPYDKITRENQREAAEKEKAAQPKPVRQEKAVADTNAAQLAAAVKEVEKPETSHSVELPELKERPSEPPELESVESTLNDISDVVNTVTIEEILAEVEKQKLESVRKAETVKSAAEISMDTAFSFDSEHDDSWIDAIPTRSSEKEEKNEATDDSDSLLSRSIMLSYLEAEQKAEEEAAEQAVRDAELENIHSVDINQFLQSKEPETESQPAESDHPDNPPAPVFEELGDSTEEFIPEILVDSAEPEKQKQQEVAEEQPSEYDAVELIPESHEPEVTAAPVAEEKPESQPPIGVFIEDNTPVTEDKEQTVEVIVADLEDEIFAKERLTSPDGSTEEDANQPSGLDVEDKIEKLAEAAEIAEVFRQESGDVAPDEEQAGGSSDVFNVSIDEISATPEAESEAEEEILEYKPREKTRQPDENLFESVLIVDENPSMIDKKASESQDTTQFLHLRESPENPTAVFKLPEGPIVFPTDIDDAEFQEQWLDEDEDGDDMASRNKRTRRRISAFIGAVALLFAVMILFSAVKTVVSGFNNIGSTSEKKTEYTEFISPVVVNDPMPFESVDKADNSMLLQSSIWQALRELDETEGYEHVSDATDKIVLPAENVEKAARELFGKNVKLNMNVLSENDGSALYYYDSIDKTFHITRGGITGPSAVITQIAQKSDYISLVVGYVQQQEMTLTSSEGTEAECYKFMEYILTLNSDGSYFIKSIRNYVED